MKRVNTAQQVARPDQLMTLGFCIDKAAMLAAISKSRLRAA